jgi:hypothetical protein
MMEKKYFYSIQNILDEIIKNNFDRDFCSLIAINYFFDENNTFIYDYDSLNDYSFFFSFLDNDQFIIDDNDFKNIILKINELGMGINRIKMKKIIYSKELNIINKKFNDNKITEDVYNYLIKKLIN